MRNGPVDAEEGKAFLLEDEGEGKDELSNSLGTSTSTSAFLSPEEGPSSDPDTRFTKIAHTNSTYEPLPNRRESFETPSKASLGGGGSGGRGWCVFGSGAPGRRRRLNCLDIAGITLVVVAAISLVGALVLPPIIHRKVDSTIDQQTVVQSPSSPGYDAEAYETFVTSAANKDLHILFATNWLNLTNPNEVLMGAAPVVQEVGPYIYREYRHKIDLVFSDDGDMVSFVLYKYFVWDEDENAANGLGLSDVNDRITTLSAVMQVLMAQIKSTFSLPTQQVMMWDLLLDGMQGQVGMAPLWVTSLKLVLCQANTDLPPTSRVMPFITRSPRDLFWGYCPDQLLLAMQKLVNISKDVAGKFNLDLQIPPVPRSFPGLYTNYTSEEDATRRSGRNSIYTGKITRDLLQSMNLFQNMSLVHACPNPATGPSWDDADCEVPSCYIYDGDWTATEATSHGYMAQWATEEASRVIGSDGSMFQHPLDVDEVYTFQDDYRRYVILGFEREHNDWHHIKLRKYTMRDQDWENCTVVPENAGFYQCDTPMGLSNISSTGGFPLFLSKPHFLQADPWVQDSVVGLSPSVEKHETFLDVEPYTGVTMRAHKRIQLNIQITPVTFPKMGWKGLLPGWLGEGVVKCMEHQVVWNFMDPVGNGMYVPMMWYDEYYEQPQAVRDDVQQVYTATAIAKGTKLGGLVVGVIAIVGAVVCVAVSAYRRKKAKRMGGGFEQPLLMQ